MRSEDYEMMIDGLISAKRSLEQPIATARMLELAALCQLELNEVHQQHLAFIRSEKTEQAKEILKAANLKISIECQQDGKMTVEIGDRLGNNVVIEGLEEFSNSKQPDAQNEH